MTTDLKNACEIIERAQQLNITLIYACGPPPRPVLTEAECAALSITTRHSFTKLRECFCPGGGPLNIDTAHNVASRNAVGLEAEAVNWLTDKLRHLSGVVLEIDEVLRSEEKDPTDAIRALVDKAFSGGVT